MDEQDKKRLAELNAATDRRTDLLLGAVMASPYSWAFLVVFGAICFGLGIWAAR